MKIFTLFVSIFCISINLFSQKKYFEGDLVYNISVKSRVPGLTDNDARKLLAVGETLKVSIKNGSYRRSSELMDEYYIGKDQKVYFKFKKFDTLYYMDYSSDTSRVSEIVKSDSVFNISGYTCKVINIKTSTRNSRYYYSSTLINNPEYDRTNTIGNFNEYINQTGGAIYLLRRSELQLAMETDSCVRIEAKDIDDHILALPALPTKKFEIESFVLSPKFPGAEDRWAKYLQANLDSKVVTKYLKLRKGQNQATQIVMVEFVVSRTGILSDIHVLNKDEVHPKLAEEAMRVIQESPRWTPAVVYGEKVPYVFRQPVVFRVERG